MNEQQPPRLNTDVEQAFAAVGRKLGKLVEQFAAQGLMGVSYRGDTKELRSQVKRQPTAMLQRLADASLRLAAACVMEVQRRPVRRQSTRE